MTHLVETGSNGLEERQALPVLIHQSPGVIDLLGARDGIWTLGTLATRLRQGHICLTCPQAPTNGQALVSLLSAILTWGPDTSLDKIMACPSRLFVRCGFQA